MKVKFLKLFAVLFFCTFLLPLAVFGEGGQDTYNGLSGTTTELGREQGGGVVGKCDGKQEHSLCTSTGAVKPTCEYTGGRNSVLSCTARECSSNYVLHMGYGFCRTEKAANKFCESRVRCNSSEIAVAKIVDNPYGRSGKAFKDCFCADKNVVKYDCGYGVGTPPTDSKTYTNLDPRVLLENTGCKMDSAQFLAWKCGDKNYNPGDSFKTDGAINCSAQWKCNECKPGNGCECSVNIESGKCTYKTTPKQGYVIKSGDGTPNPVCEVSTKCPDGNGTPPNCQCKEPQSRYVPETNSCECPEGKPLFENGQCIAPTNCPDGATGTPPNCQCKEPQGRYVPETNSCECPEDKPVFENGQCIAPTNCPDGATGTPPNCQCKEPQSRYVPETNSCECPEDKPLFENGQCVAPKTLCPEDATGTPPNCKCTDIKKNYDPKTNKCVENKLDELRKKYEDAKANEQSKANRTLTAATTAAMGIGAMELAQGLAEQKADKNAQQNMDAYIATMRCTYGDGKSVKAGPNEVELPGGNDSTIMQYRNEYIALAADLKQRKESLNMKPGIESEVIYDKATMGLYDDENVGISGGQYASLYRATMLESEADQAKIKEEQETSATRVKGGAIALGAGAVVGIAGNSLINGKLGEKIKEIKENINYKNNEETALKDLKQCLKDAGATNVNKLKFDKFTPSVLNLDNIDCKNDLVDVKGKDATALFADSDDGETITAGLVNSFGEENASKMLGEDTGNGIGYCYFSIEDLLVRGNTEFSECEDLETGDWLAKFPSGETIRGISVCSTVRPDGMEHGFVPEADQQQKIQASYDDWVKDGRKKPQVGSDRACYCKMNGVDKNWVFESYFTGFGCGDGCATSCGQNVNGYKDYAIYKDFRDRIVGRK